MIHLALLLFGVAQADDIYVVPRNSVQAIRQSEDGGPVAASLVRLFAEPDKLVVKRAIQDTKDAFAEAGVEARVEAVPVVFAQPVSCVAEVYQGNPDGSLLGSMLVGYKLTPFTLPAGERWVLHVNTDGSLYGWIGDFTGETMVTLLERFREEGVAVAVCYGK